MRENGLEGRLKLLLGGGTLSADMEGRTLVQRATCRVTLGDPTIFKVYNARRV